VTSLCYESIQWSPFIEDRPVDLIAQVGAAASAGFDGFSVDVWSLRAHRAQGGTVGDLAMAIADHGLRCMEIQALTVTEDKPAVMAEAREIAVMVDELQPDYLMTGFSGEPTEAAVANYRSAAALMPSGTRVGLEFLPNLPICDINGARAVLQRADLPHAGVVVDTWHFFHGPSSWADLQELPLAELAFVQFSDHPALESADLWHEMLQRRALPGQGHLDLELFASVVSAMGYDGMVAVEIMSKALRSLSYEEFARQAHDAAVPYWRR
jgi:sugar phosphate isomerase/epimerase